MSIQITETERVQNVAFQIKQLALQVDQLKPQAQAAITVIQSGAEGVPVDALTKALGDSKDEIVKKLETVANIS